MRTLWLIFFLPFFLPAQVHELDLNVSWRFRKLGDKEWMSATVPGTVHTDLLNNKKIPDPFSLSAESKLKWIEEANWEYLSVFKCDANISTGQNVDLILEGLDTYAKVYLNDSLVVDASNMFRSWSVPVKKLLKKQNTLRIIFTSAANTGKALATKLPYTLPEGERVFSRKAQYQYGWDFAPRYVSCGIWKPIKLRAWNTAKLEDIYVKVDSLTKKKALLNFNVSLLCTKKGDYRIELSSPELKNVLSEFNTPVEKGRASYDLPFTIKDPKLWWCNGLGDPSLYNFVVKLYHGKELLSQTPLRVGVRTIELIQEKDKVGDKFYFELNGIPVFMKGSNYVPPDVFLPRVKKQKYDQIVRSAVDANMNMLRVWGGGAYPDDEFYNACDEKGILVWQDFMFACAMYPGDTSFVHNAAQECVQQVKRLRGHPSLALWCGNNESDEGWKNWGWQKQFGYSQQDSAKIKDDYVFFFEHLLLDIVGSHDPDRARNYVGSSPQIGWGRKESLLSGDSHYWGVWWGMEPFEVYNNKVGRFMSEFGFQGMPTLETLQKNCGDVIDSACLRYYEKHSKGFQTINEYMKRDYRMPKTAADYAYVSQLLQARGLQTAIEVHRRNKPYCMGSLYWQLNDCWPGISWSTVDFNGNWKAAHYTARNCFSDVILSAIEENDSLKLYVVSDRQTKAEGELYYELKDLSGKTIWKNLRSVSLEANCSKICFALPLSEIKAYNKNSIIFTASLRGLGGGQLPSTQHYFVAPKNLDLAKPMISMRWLSNDQVELSSDVLAKNVYLFSHELVRFDDNFFDLLPGEIMLIKISGAGNKRPEVNVKSLVDTY